MPHLDEGLLNALLDNELDDAETRAAQAHLASCPECRRQYEEARALVIEAERLVALVEVPPDGNAEGEQRGPGGGTGSPWSRWRPMAWAATVVLAAGLGWLASDLRFADRPLVKQEALGSARSDLSRPAVGAASSPAPMPEAKPAAVSAAKKEPPPTSQPGERGAQERPEPPASPLAAYQGAIATDAVKDLDSATGVPTPAALEDARKEAGRLNAAGEEARPQPELAAAEAPARARALPRRAFVPGFRQLEMEDAVRTLAGSIRLVDGLVPLRILVGPGSSMSGGDQSRSMIRVVYEDPPGRELWLDQQRPGPEGELALRGKVGILLPGDTVATTVPGGLHGVRWIDQHGFRLALTGYLPDDSLRAIITRVH